MKKTAICMIMSFALFMSSHVQMLEARASKSNCSSCTKKTKKTTHPVKAVIKKTGKVCKTCTDGIKTVGKKVIKEPLEKVFSPKKSSTTLEGKLIEISSKEELDTFKQGEKPLVLEIYTPWCGACKQVLPELKKAAKKYPQVVVAKVNADSLTFVRNEYGIKGYPTFLFFKNGQKVSQHLGSLSAHSLQKEIGKLL